jgi:type II secretory pathway pseudopilin PulG
MLRAKFLKLLEKRISGSTSFGFSLIETLVALGLLSGFALLVSSQSVSTSKNLIEGQATGDYLSLTSQVTGLLMNSNSCSSLFNPGGGGALPTLGALGTPIALAALYQSPGVVLVQGGQNFGRLSVIQINLVPLTQPLQSDLVGSTYSQYAKLTVTVASQHSSPPPGTPQQVQAQSGSSQDLNFGLTIFETSPQSSPVTLTGCGAPQPWTGTLLGQNQPCPSDSALQWDGVQFFCRPILCQTGTIQMGLAADGITPNCIKYPQCPAPSATTPTYGIVFFKGSFVCKGVTCPNGKFASAQDSDGFISACNATFNDLLNNASGASH